MNYAQKNPINCEDDDVTCSLCGSQIICDAGLNMPKLAGKLYMEDFVHSIKVSCKGCGRILYEKEYSPNEEFQWEEIMKALKDC
jgi:hypothetical protein